MRHSVVWSRLLLEFLTPGYSYLRLAFRLRVMVVRVRISVHG